MITRARVQRERKFNLDVLDHREREDREREGKRMKERGRRRLILSRVLQYAGREAGPPARSLSTRPRPSRNLRFFEHLQRGSCDEEEGSRGENGEWR